MRKRQFCQNLSKKCINFAFFHENFRENEKNQLIVTYNLFWQADVGKFMCRINFAFFHENFRKNSIFFKFSKNKKFQKIDLTENLTRFLADNLEKHLLALLTVLASILQNFQCFSWLFKNAEMIFIGANLGFLDAFMRADLDFFDWIFLDFWIWIFYNYNKFIYNILIVINYLIS
jgi:hypothetical protein